MFFKKKRKGSLLPPEHAEQILAEVFDSCGFQRNTVPLEALTSYANYRKEKYTIQRTLIIAILLLFLFLPLLFVSAKIIIAVRLEKENENPVYDVSVSSIVPVDSITVMMNGRTVPVYKAGSHDFVIRPIDNGDMAVSVTLINKQISQEEHNVSGIDVTGPVLVSVDTSESEVILTIEDSESGLSPDGVTLVLADGTSYPFLFDPEAGTVTFMYPPEPVTLTAGDMKGNPLTVQITP